MFRLKWWLRSGAVIGSLLAALVFAGTAIGVREISIDQLGFMPGLVNADGPQDLRWTNNTDTEQSVTSTEGLFDSGPIPVGGGYSMKLQVPGNHEYLSNTTHRRGTIVVPLHSLPGGSTDPVAEHIPDLEFPPVADGDVMVDPRWGVPASRTRILLGFKPGVTVGQANAALAAAHTTIIGGLPDVGILLAQAQESPVCTLCDSFYYLKSALTSFRADPNVDFASMSLLGTGQSVPRGPGDSATQDDPKFPGSGWTWRTTDTGGNWGLKAARFPQAWNLLESIRRKSPTAITGIVDGGFDNQHPDLEGLKVASQVCTTGGTCRTLGNEPTYDHGTLIAGIIGAAYDNDLDAQHPSKSRGVSGANPVASVVAYPSGDFNNGSFFGGKEAWIADKELELFTMILSSASNRPQVLNYSGGIATFLDKDGKLRKDDQGNTIWWKNFPNKTCGPGPNDDESPTSPGTQLTCTPDNEDGWLKEMGQIGRTTARVAKLASQNKVMIVQAAGNDSWFFCNPPSDDCHAAIRAENRNEFAWVSANWSRTLHYDADGLTDPVLAVEAIVPPSQGLAQFSNYGGDIAAPGFGILSTVAGGKYGAQLGTSMAAPYVTALVGYLLADDPSLTLAQLRHRVLDYAAPPRPGSISAPRLDAFASMLAGPGAAKRLVDVNDSSADGDRRVIRTRNDDGTIGETEDDTFSPVRGEQTAPDGYVDMRDFRRFRDAYLQVCATGAGDPLCPAPSDIELDGGDSSPKKDLNFDHCVAVEPANPDDCDAHEKDFSRFDFNGDGQISVGRHALVPLTEDGQPVAKIADGAQLTDLDVLQSQWSPNPKTSEGWSAADLPSLVRSADLELHADSLFDLGASKAEVQVRTAGDGEPIGPKRVMKRGDGPAIVTVPLGDDLNREYEVVTTAKTMDGEAESVSQQLKLAYGDDRRVDLCPGTILEADPTRVPADGNSRSTIRLELSSCEGTRDVANKPITWGLSPSTGGASLDLVPAKTDGDGKAVARFLAGTTPATYTIEATVDFGGGDTESRTVTIRTVPKLTIRYAWRQVYEDFNESGSTRWATTNPLTPDCTIPGVVEYCIDSWHLQLSAQDTYGARRDGTLVGGGANFMLTEAASGTFGETTDSWTTSKPDGTTHFADDRNQWFVTDPNAYQDYNVKGLTADEEADGLHLSNLDVVGRLPYHYSLVSTRTGGQVLATPIELGSVATSMLMVPQDDGGQIRFAAGPGQQIVFGRNPDGTLKPYQSCGRLDQDLTTQPGYYVATTSDYIPGALTLNRKPDYTGGDRPMPVGPGHLRVRYEFAAVATYDGQASGDPVLPDCTQNHPPTAAFTYTPQDPDEGRQVRFEDASTDTENDISKWDWSFGDGSSASGPNAWHIYKDNGTYDVTLTVTDKDGATDSTTKQVVVANLPPEAEIDDAIAEVGQPLRIVSRAMDAGAIDKTQLQFSITSTNAAFQELSGTRDEANVYTDIWTGLPEGVYPLTLTVTDKDGGVATATATAVVTANIVDPPLQNPHFYGTCDPNVKLDAEETRFLDEVNEYRALNGLDPVAVSPTLNHAAEEHADDMATHGFLSHIGSDGSTAAERVWRAGYPRRASNSENIARGTPNGHDALWAWRGSTHGHNENMLDPDWRAVGIARQQGSGDWYWSTSYGDELDCPTPSGTTAPASLAKAAAVAEESASVPESSGGVETEVATHRLAPTTTTDTATATPEYPPTPAFTISKSDPISGHPVTFTNRSRDSLGNPIGATIRFGDGSDPRTLGPNESTQFTFEYASGFNVEVAATDSAGQTASVRRYTEVADPPQPWLTYTGQTEVVSGSTLAAKVRVTTNENGAPLPGLTITFKLGWDNAHSATAVTDADGVAEADVPLDGLTPDQYYLSVQFDGTPDWSGIWITTLVDIIGNHPPTADAGGPYVTGFGHAPPLDASSSSDPDASDSIASYEWDLNGDGAYDDATGKYPLLSWNDVSTLVCGGTCEDGHEYPIGLRVTDTRGESSTAQATARFVSDFTLMLGGDNRTVVPGKSNSFAVSVIAAGSFTEPVTLSAEGLPDGITGEFSVNPVEPGHMSVLTLTASDDAQTGTFPVVVSGTGGGVTHTVSDDLNVAFGLIPICYGTVTGTVKDADTGEPLAGVEIAELNDGRSVQTDASGRFTFHDAHLGDANAPLTHYVEAKKSGWWVADANGLVACGGTTTIDLDLLKKKSVQASGRVVEGETDPIDRHVVPTDRPIANAAVWPSYVIGSTFTTDADGMWSGSLALGTNNTPLTYTLNGSAPGYWQQSKQVTAADADLTDLNFALVKKCYGTMKGGVVTYSDNGAPAPYHTVELMLSGSERYYAQTDANGVYTFDKVVPLGYNNTPVSYQLTPEVASGDPPGSGGEPRTVAFANCGDERSVNLSILRAEMRYAWLEGHVTDDRTHEPVGGVTLSSLVPSQPAVLNTTTTDDTGYYKIKVGLGYGMPSAYASVAAAKQGYESISGATWVSEGQVGRVDIQMHRPLTTDRTLTGLVRDAATGAPIAGALVSDGCLGQIQVCVNTDADGRYAKTLTLDDRIGSIGRYVTASAAGYWPHAQSVTLPPNETTTLNFELVHKCENATVSGTVVDAQTQLPIEGAQVLGGGAVSYADAFGHFRLEHIEPGLNNAPLQVAITASALGYYAQTKTVTVFCGANLIVDFGKRETSLGTIAGTITNAAGQPMANVFVGSEFGGSATTDASGDYQIDAVPLGDLNSDRAWDVTAIPDGFASQTKRVVAKANVVVRADFTFGNANHKPTAAAQSLSTDQDTALPLTLAASDPDGDPLTYTVTSAPAHGTLTGSAPALTYEPDAGWSGTDSFDFVANDGTASSDPATVTITVNGRANAAPVAADDAATIPEDGSTVIDVLANDSPGAGDSTQHLTAALLGQPKYGSASVTAGGIAYSPEENFDGTDSFAYRACDDGTPSKCATANVTVTVTPVNDAPAVTLDPVAAAPEGSTVGLTAHGSDVDGDPLTFTWHADGGTIAADGDKATLEVGNGPATISVSVTVGDGTLASETHTTVTVYDVAPNVDAGPDTTGVEGAAIALHASFTDPGTGAHTATIDWGDGTVTDGSVSGRDVAGEHAYADDGSYAVKVTVDDAGGETGSDTTTLDVSNAPPKVDAGNDTTAPWGIDVAFVGTVTDPGSADAAAGLHPTWSFGDGSTPTAGLATAHAYDKPGTYTATLGATDKDGAQASDDVTVQIVRRDTTLGLEGSTSVPAGTTTVSARLGDGYDKATARLAGRDVVFELAGATYHGTTDSGGLATMTAAAPLAPGTYTLKLRFPGDDLYAPSQATATLEVVTQTTSGLVTGGALRSSADGRGGFNVHSDGLRIWGQLQYQSATAGNFHASTMTSFAVAPDGRSARFAGIGDDGRRFVTYVEDNGEPGTRDVWRLWLDGRLESDGTLRGGNIQIHG